MSELGPAPALSHGPATGRPGFLRPPIVMAAAIGAGLVLHRVWPQTFRLGVAGWWTGSALLVAGLGLFAAAIRELRRAGTPVPGNRPTSAIVRSGPYRFSRNPIYVSFGLIHLALAAWLGSWWLIATWVVNAAFLAMAIVPREERYLEARFGSTYADYKSSVRRWL